MTSYLGTVHPRQLAIDSVSNDEKHDTDIAAVMAKQPDQVYRGTMTGYSYQTFYEDDIVRLTWNGSGQVLFRLQSSVGTKYVRFVYSSRHYSNSTQSIVGTGQDYFPNAQTWADSSYQVYDVSKIMYGTYDSGSYGTIPTYEVTVHYSYYETYWEVKRHD